MLEHATEVARGERFDFGANWARFLGTVNDERIAQAEKSLCEMLAVRIYTESVFLMSAAAPVFSVWQRGAWERVSIPSTTIRSRSRARGCFAIVFSGDADWKIDQGSVLDAGYLATSGAFRCGVLLGRAASTGAM